MLKIETSLDPVEIDGEHIKGLPESADALLVKAHWNISDFVVLDWRGHSITVVAEDLRRAIQNAINHS